MRISGHKQMFTIGIDAGNSRMKIGLFKNSRLVEVRTVETRKRDSLKVPAGWKKVKPAAIALASVIPLANSPISDIFGGFYGIRVRIIRPRDCGIRLGIKNPDRVGVDRILNCMAGMELFGSPVVVVDAGTAVTVDSATRNEGFTGGSIMPGRGLWAKTLTSASLIGKSRPAKHVFPGRNTDEAISCGIRYGLPGAVNGILAAALKKYPGAAVILTGGDVEMLKDGITFKFVTRRYLALEGIGLLLAGRYHEN